MTVDQGERLLGLAVVIVVAVGAVWTLLRMTHHRAPEHDGLVLGYPPDQFPVQRVVRHPALRALAATQARLVSVYRQLPVSDRTVPVNDLAIWLRVFLAELRQMMDTAYRVAVITDAYGRSAHLDRLAAEVQQLETQIADDITQRLLGYDGGAHDEVLNRRLAMLRSCARELASLEGERTSARFAE